MSYVQDNANPYHNGKPLCTHFKSCFAAIHRIYMYIQISTSISILKFITWFFSFVTFNCKKLCRFKPLNYANVKHFFCEIASRSNTYITQFNFFLKILCNYNSENCAEVALLRHKKQYL